MILWLFIALVIILAGRTIWPSSSHSKLSTHSWKRYKTPFYSISYPRQPKVTISKESNSKLVMLTYFNMPNKAGFSSSFTKTSNKINELALMPLNKPKQWFSNIHKRGWTVTINKILSYKHYNKDGFSVRDATYELTFQDLNAKLNVYHFVSHAIYYVKPHLVIRTNASSWPGNFHKNQRFLNKFLKSFRLTTSHR